MNTTKFKRLEAIKNTVVSVVIYIFTPSYSIKVYVVIE